MVHIPFDTRSVGYDDHHAQIGGGAGDDLLGEPYNYFKGLAPYQRGYGRYQKGEGIGAILRGLWRMLRPVLRTAGKAVAKETLSTGGRILEKMEEGTPIKEAVVGEAKRGIDNLYEKGGVPKQFGTGRRGVKKTIKTKRYRSPSSIHKTIVGRIPPSVLKKRKRIDTFGLY